MQSDQIRGDGNAGISVHFGTWTPPDPGVNAFEREGIIYLIHWSAQLVLLSYASAAR